MQNNEEYIQEWYERGNHDLITAKLALEGGGPADTIAVLLQQASEKCLKGYLISRGWRLKKTHDLVELIEVASKYNSVFKNHVELAERLTALYLAERYPSMPQLDYPKEEIASLVKQTETLITLIQERTK